MSGCRRQSFGDRVFDTRRYDLISPYARNIYRVETCSIPSRLCRWVTLCSCLLVAHYRQYPAPAISTQRQNVLLMAYSFDADANEVVRNLISNMQVIVQSLQGDYGMIKSDIAQVASGPLTGLAAVHQLR